jgi:hypothetical protein
VWARCGAVIRAQDKRFDDAEDETLDEPGVVDRLPLRAGNTTQVSQEVYINDGVEPTNLSAVLARLDAPAMAPDVYTSPDLPSNRPSPGSASLGLPRRSRWPVVIALVAIAAVIGMVLGVVVPGGSKPAPQTQAQLPAVVPEAPKPEAPKPEAPKPEAPRPEAPRPTIEPVQVAVVTPAPTPVADEPKPAPAKKVVKPRVVEVAPPVKPRAEKQAPGKLSIDAQPWATIYVDGAKKGPTPIPNLSLAAGDHTIKAVTQDGRTKTIKIHVDPGATVRRKVTW